MDFLIGAIGLVLVGTLAAAWLTLSRWLDRADREERRYLDGEGGL